MMDAGVIHIAAVQCGSRHMDDRTVFEKNATDFLRPRLRTDFKAFPPVVPNDAISHNHMPEIFIAAAIMVHGLLHGFFHIAFVIAVEAFDADGIIVSP